MVARAVSGLSSCLCVALMMLTSAGLTAAFEDPAGATPASAAGRRQFIEDEAERALGDDRIPFDARTRLLVRLQHARERAEDSGRAGRLSLLWLRTLRWTLSAVPMDGADRPPYRDWLAANETITVYNEPGGLWMIAPDLIWRVHDAHRGAAEAEAIAWLAVENGLPGECEGYVPCHAHSIDRLHGEYLRRHPDGVHAGEAADAIRSSCEQSIELLTGPNSDWSLDRSRDCGELVDRLDSLRRALLESTSDERAQALASVDALRATCP